MSAWGALLGQPGFFAVRSKEKAPLGIRHFIEEGERLAGVLDKRLGQGRYLGGDDYSVADMATYPWAIAATTMLAPVLGSTLDEARSMKRWMDDLAARPAVVKGMKVLEH